MAATKRGPHLSPRRAIALLPRTCLLLLGRCAQCVAFVAKRPTLIPQVFFRPAPRRALL